MEDTTWDECNNQESTTIPKSGNDNKECVWGDWDQNDKTNEYSPSKKHHDNVNHDANKDTNDEFDEWSNQATSYSTKPENKATNNSSKNSNWGDWDTNEQSTNSKLSHSGMQAYNEKTTNYHHSNEYSNNFNSNRRHGNRNNQRWDDDDNNNFNNRQRSNNQRNYGESTNEQSNGWLSNNNNTDKNFNSYTTATTTTTTTNYNDDYNNNYGDNSQFRQPITYEPTYLNYDEKQLFERNHTGGIDFNNYEKIDVEMTGGDGLKLDRITSFDQCELNPKIYENVKRCNYSQPTPIQKSVIPIVTKTTHDIMACAQTGSGKTAAFLLPIFSKMLATYEHNGRYNNNNNFVPSPTVLLIGPTRELVNQLFMEMQKFSWGTGINCARVYGGVSRRFLLQGLQNDCHVLSATPGRLLAFLKNGEISLENIKYLILDEADRMLDMGFIGDIKSIINNYGLPNKELRRCYMFSATFPADVQKLAAEILNPNFYFITVGMVGGAAESISQKLEKLQLTKKRERLIEILSELSKNTKSLIFVETKRQADYLTIYLCESGFDAISIHGDRLQQQREQALHSFVNGISPILVATSVAARGLDIPSVDLVINYDMPHDVDEYVHRIGRTGRIGHRGLAISFFQENRDEPLALDLLKILTNADQEIPDWLQLIGGVNLNISSNKNLLRQHRDVRYDMESNDKLFRQKFNAMDLNPYSNSTTTNQKYTNDNFTTAWNDNTNKNGNIGKENDEEYW